MQKSIFYRPEDGVAADFIPFYKDGIFHLFYLKDYRDVNQHGEGTPWFHLVTNDFIHYEDLGEALPRASIYEQDLFVFTGCVIENQRGRNDFRIFYTGHNPHFGSQSKPVQGVMMATSSDLISWEKDKDFIFMAPCADGYEPDDWRDPLIFWVQEREEYWMLLAARKDSGPARNRGLTALAVSSELNNWEVKEPFWAPDRYYTHECPDLFKMGDWWYLVFSTFSEKTVTHYRISRSLNGPWVAPSDDQFDGRAFYAAKTASDGKDRYIFGWLPTRTDEKDNGEWNWGGNLVVHQLLQQPDGSLSVDIPEMIRHSFHRLVSGTPEPILGIWEIEPDSVYSSSTNQHSILNWSVLPHEAMVKVTIELHPGTVWAGLMLRAAEDMSSYYQVRLEPVNARVVIDSWPRPGDQPFILEKHIALGYDQPIEVELVISGSCLVVYVNQCTALSCRLYDHPYGNLGFFVTEGEAIFENIQILQRDEMA